MFKYIADACNPVLRSGVDDTQILMAIDIFNFAGDQNFLSLDKV